MAQPLQPAGVDTALAHAEHLLAHAPDLAAEQARQVLASVPGEPSARLILAKAFNAGGKTGEALALLESLALDYPDAPTLLMELGLALAVMQRRSEAIVALERAAYLEPTLPCVWLRLASHKDEAGDRAGAEAAYVMHVRHGMHDPQLRAAGNALREGRLEEAERELRARLRELPDDVAAMRTLAELGARLGRNEDALALLERSLQLAPGFAMARHNHAVVLDRLNRQQDALAEVETLLADDPDNFALQNLKALLLGKLGNYGDAIRLYESILASRPGEATVWMSLGHALKTAGFADRAILAYRRAIRLQPGLGTAWWSLANLKTMRFDVADVAAMQARLDKGGLDDEQRLHFDFALGKALEDAGDYGASFAHYARGNALRRGQLAHDAMQASRHLLAAQAVYTRDFLTEHAGVGFDDPSPIFVVGMPRSGSTLVEQILCSHGDIEATMELPDIGAITRRLHMRAQLPASAPYHPVVGRLGPEVLRELGKGYIASTRVQRRLGRRLFIDKMPNNFAHVGLIHLILPNARIVDVRRHPMACGFSNFKQHFARGQAFSYDLEDMGRHYLDYVGLMAHFDRVLPGRVHRVFYEDLVADTEGQVRALLDYCGVPFDAACLRFFENDRPVRTASSEQVRQPIYLEGMDQWRHYEAWLGPLKQALGPVLDAYPAAPDEPT